MRYRNPQYLCPFLAQSVGSGWVANMTPSEWMWSAQDREEVLFWGACPILPCDWWGQSSAHLQCEDSLFSTQVGRQGVASQQPQRRGQALPSQVLTSWRCSLGPTVESGKRMLRGASHQPQPSPMAPCVTVSFSPAPRQAGTLGSL